MKDIPEVVSAYFDTDQANDINALNYIFSESAIVEDENIQHKGIMEIRSWWLAVKEKYQHFLKPLEVSNTNHISTVLTQVSGTFPNSPVKLKFQFTLENGKVVKLRIY
ncbi:nuclear transport factor 2 family protein [Acinetobacter baumannii]|uniref:nuclear transport factor 2 family protein n=1 Tax=Acinetobacter baumannii TaxID=470 RepID=UPI00233FA73A|nr:nuclear transport factor 2 family protein [Acinetobacter baumannii]MDC4261925.1 nuclear transport factor 2 family protein [Acinetobacter baumannii]MDH2526204.1 nuclear transport factor 2 family protein [Acinetobacter baumannii]MDH2631242.1 nuclear transport factor 2 family protein [Acinetobacter baumannii]MDO7453493.1 nuclear transport factor 2 family protein [Acinetobacter baumannii]HCA5261291.1 nuclear transport factor 2 family protein [Acinetobacter baumannii]